MANYLEATPGVAAQIDAWRDFLPDMVPIARDGALVGLFSEECICLNPPAAPLPVQDFVVGMELLGYTFEVVPDPKRGHVLGQYDPTGPCPEGWHAHALALMRAMTQDRTGEVIAFLVERDGVAGDGR